MTLLETRPQTSAPVTWDDGRWLNEPPRVEREADDLVMHAREGSDFWRSGQASSGCHDGHALLQPFAVGDSVDVSFALDFHHRLDQAGILIRESSTSWVKAGVEICDGAAHVGAVVTKGTSDWSMTPVPAWRASIVTIRAIWTSDALVLCALSSQSAWRTLRVCPWDAESAEAGPYCASPERADLAVRFTSWTFGPSATLPQARLATRG